MAACQGWEGEAGGGKREAGAGFSPVFMLTIGARPCQTGSNTLLLGGEDQRSQKYQSASTLEAFTERLPKGLETGDILFYRDSAAWTAVAGQFAQPTSIPVEIKTAAAAGAGSIKLLLAGRTFEFSTVSPFEIRSRE
jgi:hypothetical protein